MQDWYYCLGQLKGFDRLLGGFPWTDDRLLGLFCKVTMLYWVFVLVVCFVDRCVGLATPLLDSLSFPLYIIYIYISVCVLNM